MKFVLVFLFVLCFSAISYSQNPGVQIRVSRKGIDLAQKVAAKELSGAIRRLHLPREPIPGGSVTNVRFPKFNLGKTSATTSRPNRFTVNIRGASLTSTLRYRASKKIIFVRITAKGRATITGSRINIRQEIILKRDFNGRPRLSAGSCSASIGKFDYRLKGNVFSWLLNILRGFLRNPLRRRIQREICPKLQSFLNDYDGDKLNRINTNFPFFYSKINLDLVRNPAASSTGLTAAFRAQCFRKSRKSPPRTSFSARYVPALTSSTRMVHISISDYVLDTLLHTMWMDNRFQRTFSHSNIRQMGKSPTIFSKFLSKSLHKGAKYSIEIRTLRTPTSNFTTRGIMILFPTRVRVYAQTGTRKRLLLTLNLTFKVTVNIRIVRGKLSARIVSVEITTSNTRGISKSFLDSFLNSAVRRYVVPAVNSVAESGFEFPKVFRYRAQKPTIQHKNGYIIVGADFTHP